jgi:MFS transporter, DHA1 family, tetracycline resistance protein
MPSGQAPPAPGARRSPLLFIFLTVFIDLLGFGIVLPLLPIYSQAYGASGFTLALLFSCFSGMQFLFAPLWGRLSDRIGRRPVLIGGLVGTGLSYLVFANADSLVWLFTARLLAGFFGANISTAAAYIADVTTPANRARGMGLIGAAFGLGFTFGPALGGELTQVSIRLPGYLAAGLSFSAALFGYLKLPEPPRHDRTASRIFHFEELREAVRDGRIGGVLLLGFLAIFAFAAFEAMFVYFGLSEFPTKFGMTEALVERTREQSFAAAKYAGRYLFVVGLISAVIQGGLIRRLVPRFGETRLIVAGPLLLALALVIVAMATSWWMVILGCVVMPLGFGVNNPSLSSLVSRASPSDKQGAFMGINQSLASLARMTGPAAAGALFDRVGPRSPFFAAAAVLLLATAYAYGYHRRWGPSFAAEPQAVP